MGADSTPNGSPLDGDSVPRKPPGSRGGSKKGRKNAKKLLRDMRWVYEHPESEPTTESRRLCAAVLKQDKVKFLEMLTKLEDRNEAKLMKATQSQSSTGGGLAGGTGGPGSFVSTPENEPKLHKMIDLIAEVQRRMAPYSVPVEGK
jgi:hypothetical protein